MRAVQIEEGEGGPRCVIGVAPEPEIGAREILIGVRATAVNRADLMQRRGLYPPPPGASPVLGLECAGEVEAVGDEVSRFRPGQRVMALLAGGGYAERVTVDQGSALEIPERLDFESAAAVPEVFLTCYLNLFRIAAVPERGAALVHGGGSGIGTAAIQLLRRSGVKVIVTAGSEAKCARCKDLGADAAIDYRAGEFADRVLELTGGAGVDVILDSIGAAYLDQHLRCLATGGRLILIGLMGGARAELNLASLLVKRLHVVGSTLRARPVEEKAAIVRGFETRFGADLRGGAIAPVVDRVLPLEEAQAAHDLLESSEHFGKVVLRV